MDTKRDRFSKILIDEMFQVKSGETVAITADLGSDKATIEAMAQAVQNAGGLPLVMYIPQAKKRWSGRYGRLAI